MTETTLNCWSPSLEIAEDLYEVVRLVYIIQRSGANRLVGNVITGYRDEARPLLDQSRSECRQL